MAYEWEVNCMSTGEGINTFNHNYNDNNNSSRNNYSGQENHHSLVISLAAKLAMKSSVYSQQLKQAQQIRAIEANSGGHHHHHHQQQQPHHLSHRLDQSLSSGSGSGSLTSESSNPTAFPFPPPPFYLRNLVQTHPQIPASPWLTHHPPLLPYSASSTSTPSSSSSSSVSSSEAQLPNAAIAAPLPSKSLHEKNGSSLESDSTSLENSKHHSSVQSKTQMNGGERHQNPGNLTVGGTVVTSSRPLQENSLNWLADVAVQSGSIHRSMSPDHKKDSPSGCSSEDSTSSFSQRNDTHFRASDIPTGPVPYSSIPFQFPQGAFANQFPGYLSAFCPTQYTTLHSGHPSSPFLVPTPPASAPPTVRSTYFSSDAYHQALLNANPSSSIPVPQNLSIRSPSYQSPISLSINSPPPSGRNASPVSLKTRHDYNIKEDDSLSIGHSQKSNEISDVTKNFSRGKEGSLKHRILRVPSIRIESTAAANVEPAAMSAPPVPDIRHGNVKKIPYTTSESISQDGLRYPQCFHKGSCISLADGTVKHVEDMSTEDFLNCATLTPNLKIDSSVVLGIKEKKENRSVLITFAVGKRSDKFTVEAPVEHPFYVYNQGWASCCPEKTLLRYGLECRKLRKENVCVSLTRSNSGKSESRLAQEPKSSQSAISEDKVDQQVQQSPDQEMILAQSTPSYSKKRRYSAPSSIHVNDDAKNGGYKLPEISKESEISEEVSEVEPSAKTDTQN